MKSRAGAARFALLLLAAALGGCGVGTLPVATPGDAARAGVELAQLEHGRNLVAAKCTGCHRAPLPAEHRTSDWPRMLDEMSARSHLDGEQRDAIQRYMITMSTAPAATAAR